MCLNSAGSAAALVFDLPSGGAAVQAWSPVYTHWHRVWNTFQNLGKNTIFNEHPVHNKIHWWNDFRTNLHYSMINNWNATVAKILSHTSFIRTKNTYFFFIIPKIINVINHIINYENSSRTLYNVHMLYKLRLNCVNFKYSMAHTFSMQNFKKLSSFIFLSFFPWKRESWRREIDRGKRDRGNDREWEGEIETDR